MNQAFKEYLLGFMPAERIIEKEPLKRHTSFRTGGEAECFLEIASAEELKKILFYLDRTENPFFVLGNGSNLLIGDKGYQGTILHIGKELSDISVEGNIIRAGAGAMLSAVAMAAAENSLTGMEFASGIPGSIGGAVYMNAGAYGGEMSDIITSVKVVSRQGEEFVFSKETMEFSYRESILKKEPYYVTEVELLLENGNMNAIKEKMSELAKQRREKQPLEYPSAGSTFKRPEGYFAGKLIMDAGLRGLRVGGAQVSEKHCGFVVNTGNATSEDIYELMQEVQERVYERFSVKLEPEIIMLGDF